MTTFAQLTDHLVGLLDEIGQADTTAGLQIHRWGTQQITDLPAAWLALQPEGEAQAMNLGCSVNDLLRVEIKIAVEPAAEGTGEDTRQLERYVDLALPLVDRAVRDAHARLGVSEAHRRGLLFDITRLGDASAQTLILPLAINWEHLIPDTTP